MERDIYRQQGEVIAKLRQNSENGSKEGNEEEQQHQQQQQQFSQLMGINNNNKGHKKKKKHELKSLTSNYENMAKLFSSKDFEMSSKMPMPDEIRVPLELFSIVQDKMFAYRAELDEARRDNLLLRRAKAADLETIAALTKRRNNLEQDLAKSKTRVDQLSSINGDLLKEREHHDKAATSLDTQLEFAKAEGADRMERLQTVLKENDDLRAKVVWLEQSRDGLEADNEFHSKSSAAAQSRLKNSLMTTAKLASEKKNLAISLAGLSQKLEKYLRNDENNNNKSDFSLPLPQQPKQQDVFKWLRPYSESKNNNNNNNKGEEEEEDDEDEVLASEVEARLVAEDAMLLMMTKVKKIKLFFQQRMEIVEQKLMFEHDKKSSQDALVALKSLARDFRKSQHGNEGDYEQGEGEEGGGDLFSSSERKRENISQAVRALTLVHQKNKNDKSLTGNDDCDDSDDSAFDDDEEEEEEEEEEYENDPLDLQEGEEDEEEVMKRREAKRRKRRQERKARRKEYRKKHQVEEGESSGVFVEDEDPEDEDVLARKKVAQDKKDQKFYDKLSANAVREQEEIEKKRERRKMRIHARTRRAIQQQEKEKKKKKKKNHHREGGEENHNENDDDEEDANDDDDDDEQRIVAKMKKERQRRRSFSTVQLRKSALFKKHFRNNPEDEEAAAVAAATEVILAGVQTAEGMIEYLDVSAAESLSLRDLVDRWEAIRHLARARLSETASEAHTLSQTYAAMLKRKGGNNKKESSSSSSSSATATTTTTSPEKPKNIFFAGSSSSSSSSSSPVKSSPKFNFGSKNHAQNSSSVTESTKEKEKQKKKQKEDEEAEESEGENSKNKKPKKATRTVGISCKLQPRPETALWCYNTLIQPQDLSEVDGCLFALTPKIYFELHNAIHSVITLARQTAKLTVPIADPQKWIGDGETRTIADVHCAIKFDLFALLALRDLLRHAGRNAKGTVSNQELKEKMIWYREAVETQRLIQVDRRCRVDPSLLKKLNIVDRRALQQFRAETTKRFQMPSTVLLSSNQDNSDDENDEEVTIAGFTHGDNYNINSSSSPTAAAAAGGVGGVGVVNNKTMLKNLKENPSFVSDILAGDYSSSYQTPSTNRVRKQSDTTTTTPWQQHQPQEHRQTLQQQQQQGHSSHSPPLPPIRAGQQPYVSPSALTSQQQQQNQRYSVTSYSPAGVSPQPPQAKTARSQFYANNNNNNNLHQQQHRHSAFQLFDNNLRKVQDDHFKQRSVQQQQQQQQQQLSQQRRGTYHFQQQQAPHIHHELTAMLAGRHNSSIPTNSNVMSQQQQHQQQPDFLQEALHVHHIGVEKKK